MKSEISFVSIILLVGLFTIVTVTSVSSQPDDPPNQSYPTTNTITTSYVGTATIETSQLQLYM